MTKETDRVAREGFFLIFLSFIFAIGLGLYNSYAGLLGGLWFVFCVSFFRNPRRVTPEENGKIICPADGTVIFVGRATEPDFLKKEMNRVTIFMSPFNVHVNRAPESGVVKGKIYHKGKYLAAFDEKASLENERSAIHMETAGGDDIVFVQIAGWFARRIVSYPQIGARLFRGKIFGVIKFGSRMDVYYPDGFLPSVALKQKVKAGETVLASK